MQTFFQEDAREAFDAILKPFTTAIEAQNKQKPLSPDNFKINPENGIHSLNPLTFWIQTERKFDISSIDPSLLENEFDEEGWQKEKHYQPCMILPLSLQNTENISFESALNEWHNGRKGGDPIKKNGVSLSLEQEKNSFCSLPKHLFFQCKRFSSNPNNHSEINKITRIVDIKKEFTIPGKYVKTNQNGLYSIKGVINHIGNHPDFGHYTTCINTQKGNFLCNDEIIIKLNEKTAQDCLENSYLIYAELKHEISTTQLQSSIQNRKLQITERELHLTQSIL